MEVWQEILLWVVVFVDLFIFAKLSEFNVRGRPIIELRWRILIAVLFPLIFVVALMFGVFLVGVALIVLLILFLLSRFGKKKYNFRIRIF